MAFNSMIHLNGNILCVVDCGTTGLRPGIHDLVRIAVLPLNATLEPNPKYLPFYLDLIPKRPNNFDRKESRVSRATLCDIGIRGVDPDRAADLFCEWFDRLNLGWNKRVSPLAHNWPFDRAFLIDWLGHDEFERIFDFRYRDTMPSALYANDRSDFCAEKFPYPKVNLTYLASQLNISRDLAHDPLQDCITTAQIYKSMMKQLF